MRKWIVWTAAVVIATALGGGWYFMHAANTKNSENGPAPNAPVPVATSLAEKGEIAVNLNALGTVTALANVTVRTQISGQLIQTGFQEGSPVKEGDFLAQIDPRPYEIALAQAEGQLMHDQALLKDAELNLGRYKKLMKQDSISRQQFDSQEALVQQYTGTVQTDQAAIDSAKLNLTYCHITAPLSGRTGLRVVDVGNYVQPSDTNGIVTLAQTQPITVVFTLPEDTVPALIKRMKQEEPIEVSVFDRDQTNMLARGTLVAAHNQIDTSTGTLKLRAQFDNADENLFPNQFVNVKLLLDTLRDVTVVPLAAIQRGLPGTFVYLVNPDNGVILRPVKLGPDDGTKVAITEGLVPGDKVVIDGADKLREGSRVALPGEGSTTEKNP